MAEKKKSLELAVNYKFDWFDHTFYVVDSKQDVGRLTTVCFCEKPMVYNKGKMVCAAKDCNFAIDLQSLNLLMSNDILTKPTIHLPVCKQCHGSTLECYKNSAWSSYLQPIFRCSCKQDQQMIVTTSQFPEIMEANFNIPKSVEGAALHGAKKTMVLPKQAMETGVVEKKQKKLPAKKLEAKKPAINTSDSE